MKTIYTIRDREGYIVACSMDIMRAADAFEEKEREGYINLVFKEVYESDADYKQIMRSFF